MKPFAHANASSVEEAISVLDSDCRPLAGGTDLLGLMKEDLATPKRLVNLKTIPGLAQVESGDGGSESGGSESDGGWRIGALVTLSQLAADPSVEGRSEIAALYEAILQTASPQLRHMATVGGNLIQKPRCWYYRNQKTHCWRKGGRRCFAYPAENKYHVILGGGPCYAVHPSDPAVALLALDAKVTVAGPQGHRTMPLAELYRRPDRENRNAHVLAENELITEVMVPKQPQGARSTYVKVAERATWDFALVSAAVWLTVDDGVVQSVRIALGGVALIPWRAAEAEDALIGNRLTEETIGRAAEAAVAEAKPLEHNAYKIDLVQGVIREALQKLSA